MMRSSHAGLSPNISCCPAPHILGQRRTARRLPFRPNSFAQLASRALACCAMSVQEPGKPHSILG